MSAARSAQPLLPLLTAFLLWGASLAGGADWPQWRGPDRDGIASASPPLASEWGQHGPKLVWRSEKIPCGDGGKHGFSSPVVADGRVYLFLSWTVYDKTGRVLTRPACQQLGLYNDTVPPVLQQKIEAARISSERSAIGEPELGKWIDAWLQKNLSSAERDAFGEYAADRLRRGDDAAPVHALAKLRLIADKPFPDEESFESWLTAQGVVGEDADWVRAHVPRGKPVCADTVMALDAATGRTLWKKAYPSTIEWWGMSGTPCVKNGRLYVAGAAGAYCLEAATGAEVWRVAGRQYRTNSSPAVEDGVMVFVAGAIHGLDAATGQRLWTVPADEKPDTSQACWNSSSSPAVHRVGEMTCAVLAYRGKLVCLEFKTGRVLWESPCGRSLATPVLRDGYLVLQGNRYGCGFGLAAFRLDPDGARPVCQAPQDFRGRGASALFLPGRALAVGGGGAVCLSVPKGDILFESQEARGNTYSSPVSADGKLLLINGRNLKLFEVAPDELRVLATADLGLNSITSPAFMDGLVYVRGNDGLACYDLRQPSPSELAAIHAWKRELAGTLSKELRGPHRPAAVKAAGSLARLGPIGEPVFAREVQETVARRDARVFTALLQGAARASRSTRSVLMPAIRAAMRSGDRSLLLPALQHWQAIGFPAAEAKNLLLDVLRTQPRQLWSDVAKELVALNTNNVGAVVQALLPAAGSNDLAVAEHAALLLADVAVHGTNEAVRVQAAAAAVPVLENMVLLGQRRGEAKAALGRLTTPLLPPAEPARPDSGLGLDD